MPRPISWRRDSSDSVAGPVVHTIFVLLRVMVLYSLIVRVPVGQELHIIPQPKSGSLFWGAAYKGFETAGFA